MATAESPPRLMTAEELAELPPKQQFNRWLDEGRLRREPMTYRNPVHSSVEARVTLSLGNWNLARPRPRGRVVDGEAGFRLRRNPDTLFGIDVAYISPELVAATPPDSLFFDGLPVLAVEILSPSDTSRRVQRKIDHYRKAGVPIVWIIDPYLETVLVLRRGQQPVLFNRDQELTAEPELPGFRAAVASFFDD